MSGQEWTWEELCRSLDVEIRYDDPMTATLASLFGALATKVAQQGREIEGLKSQLEDAGRATNQLTDRVIMLEAAQ